MRGNPALLVALGILLGAATARAQAPGESVYHATPPLPQVFPSPMPSLPPPVSKAPGESPSEAAPAVTPGTTIRSPGFRMRTQADGSIQFADGSTSWGSIVDPVRGIAPILTFGGTDSMMRFLGEDPYRTEKVALMEETRPQRIEIRRAFNEDQMERALSDLPRYLAAVWSAEEWPVEIRRSILFALWDECAERGNPLVVDGGKRARAIISGFITRTLPEGSQGGFTERELERFNQLRTSQEVFAPYLASR
jgi:hypothetical protein